MSEPKFNVGDRVVFTGKSHYGNDDIYPGEFGSEKLGKYGVVIAGGSDNEARVRFDDDTVQIWMDSRFDLVEDETVPVKVTDLEVWAATFKDVGYTITEAEIRAYLPTKPLVDRLKALRDAHGDKVNYDLLDEAVQALLKAEK